MAKNAKNLRVIKKLSNLDNMRNLCALLHVDEVVAKFEGASGKQTKTATADSMLHLAHIHISNGNSKIGKCYNWSLTPLLSCTEEACRTCGQEGCYACSSYRQYPDCRAAWDENFLWVILNLPKWETLMVKWLSVFRPDKFRIHVAGDFCTLEYALAWKRIILAFPETRFFGFTKQWDIVRQAKFYECPNFKLRLSAWTGVNLPLDLMLRYPVAWVDDGIETRIPADTFVCPGNCDVCNYYCANSDGATVFHKHGSDLVQGNRRTAERMLAKAS